MPAWLGQYRGKKPCVTFQVTGTRGHPAEVTATVDTGFSGFLLLSRAQAEPHGLKPIGTTLATLADGSTIPMTTALANVGFGHWSREGVATISERECQCLIGIDFLRLFQLALVLTDKKLWLVPPAELSTLPPLMPLD